jgi:hypothetical protein
MLLAKPLTELTTIWLDNVMDGVPPGDVTSCSLSVIVPRHGHSATWHSITVFIGEVLFLFSVSEVFLSELIDWFVCRNNHQTCLPRISPHTFPSLSARTLGSGRRRWRIILVPRGFWVMRLASVKGQSLLMQRNLPRLSWWPWQIRTKLTSRSSS